MSGWSRGDWSQAGSLGFTFVASVLLFTWLGHQFDGWFHTKPWLMVAGVFVGAAMGFVSLVRPLFEDSHDRGEEDQGPDEDDGPEQRPR